MRWILILFVIGCGDDAIPLCSELCHPDDSGFTLAEIICTTDGTNQCVCQLPGEDPIECRSE